MVMHDIYKLLKVLVSTFIFDVSRMTYKNNKKLKNFSGIHIESKFLTEENSNLLYKEISAIVENKYLVNEETLLQERGGAGHDEGMLDIKHIDKSIPNFSEKIKIVKLLGIIENQLGLKLIVKNINCYWNVGVQNTRGLHADNHTKDQYKAFIYLTDVLDDLDGPYCYVPDSYKVSLIRYKCIIFNYFNSRPLTDYSTPEFKVKILKAKAPNGSLIISNQNGAHRGWPQGVNNKRVLISINLI
jgi:hypothetical protein